MGKLWKIRQKYLPTNMNNKNNQPSDASLQENFAAAFYPNYDHSDNRAKIGQLGLCLS